MSELSRHLTSDRTVILLAIILCQLATSSVATSITLAVSCIWFELHGTQARRSFTTSAWLAFWLYCLSSCSYFLTARVLPHQVITLVGISILPVLSPHLSFLHRKPLNLRHDSISDPGPSAALKRTFDLCATLLALPFVIPFIAIAATATLIVDGWPAFYRQRRIGHRGRFFSIIKIRTMIKQAEPDGWPVWSTKDDSRVTKLGRFLRKFWIDELPQFALILTGQMSVIGPRPERPEFSQVFTHRWPRFAERVNVRPGLTGWAQARGFSGDTPIEDRLKHDLAYIQAWSPQLDGKILAATVYRFFDRGESPQWLPAPTTVPEGKTTMMVAPSHHPREEPDHRHRSQSQHLSQGDQLD